MVASPLIMKPKELISRFISASRVNALSTLGHALFPNCSTISFISAANIVTRWALLELIVPLLKIAVLILLFLS